LIIAAGLDGIENKTALPAAVDADLSVADNNVTKNLPLLPDSLDKAIALAEKSSFIKSITGGELFSKYLDLKKIEADDFTAAKEKTEFFRDRYFGVI
jgi:glutamine synthetase